MGVRAAVARDARRAGRALGGHERRRRQRHGDARLADAHRDLRVAQARARAPTDARDWSIKASLGRAVRLPTAGELYQGSIASNVIVNNDPNLQPERSWTSELTGERAARARQLAADGVFRGHRGCPLLADQRHGDAERHERAERRRDRHARPRSGLPSARPARWPAGFLDEPDLRAFADRGEREFPGERRQVAAARAGLARERARDVSLRRTVVADGRRPLQRHAVQHARQLRSPTATRSRARARSSSIDLRARYASERWSASVGVDNVGDEEYWAFHPYTRRSAAWPSSASSF